MTKEVAAHAAATLVEKLKKANAQVKDGPKVKASQYRELEQKLIRRFESL